MCVNMQSYDCKLIPKAPQKSSAMSGVSTGVLVGVPMLLGDFLIDFSLWNP
jgi:hypothetical protein